MNSLRKSIENNIQWCINEYLKEDNNKEIYAFCLYYSTDHNDPIFEFLIADSIKEERSYFPYNFSYGAELDSEELQEEYSKFYEAKENDIDIERQRIDFNRMLIDALRNVDYSKLKLHKDFLLWANDHDDSFHYPSDTHKLKR